MGFFEDLFAPITQFVAEREARRAAVTITLAITATGAVAIATSGITDDGDMRHVKKVVDVQQGKQYRKHKNQQYLTGERATRPTVWRANDDTYVTRPHDVGSIVKLLDAIEEEYEEAGYQVVRAKSGVVPAVPETKSTVQVERGPNGELVFTAASEEEADRVRRLVNNVQSARSKKNVAEYWTATEKETPRTADDGLTVTTSIRPGDRLWPLLRHIEEELGARGLILQLGEDMLESSPYVRKSKGMAGALGGS